MKINKIKYLSLLDKAQIFRLAKSVSKNKIRILTYHRFGESYVSHKVFKKQVKYLNKNFNIIPLSSYLDFLNDQNKLPPNSVILTVDDGYMDFFNVAFPVLKEYQVPATVFLTIDFIDKGMWLWHDLLNYGIKYTDRDNFALNENRYNLKYQKEKVELKLYLDKLCTSCSPPERDVLIDNVLRELKVIVPDRPTSEYAPLNWDQILAMSSHGISFGAHTCSHPILSRIPVDEALREIRESKHRIEEVTQNEILAFCYPNGTANDFNEDIKKMVKECGFSCAMSIIYGINDLKSDRYALRRMPADGKSFPHFLHDVSGFGVLRRKLRKDERKST